jgi:uncharacterized HAD superfamily protein
LKIGIDIDGVLTDIEKWQLDYGSKFYYENYHKGIVNNKGYETDEIFDSSHECDDLFWNKYFEEYSVNVEARKFAAEVISNLKKEGYKIYIITARGSFLDNSSVLTKKENDQIVKNWLSKNKIYYDQIIFSPEDKLNICINNKIDIMIEDKVDNINKISTKIPVICFNAGYNELCNGKNIYRVYSWYDAYYTINNKIIMK